MSKDTEGRIPVIIDCDTGVDDAGALMMACASDRLNILSVTSVSGNVGLDRTHPNAMNVMNLCGRGDVPVAKGAAKPLVREPSYASLVHGLNGLQGYQFSQETRKAEAALPAAAYMAKLLEECEEKITIVALGPLTNVAILILSRPDLLDRIDRIVFMGVNHTEGNPYIHGATFNIQVDPEAFQICLDSGVDFYACPLDTLRKAYVTRNEVEKILKMGSPVSEFIYKTGFAPREYSAEVLAQLKANGNEEAPDESRVKKFNQAETFSLLDQATMAFVIAPELFTVKKYYCEVECQGSIMDGFTYVDKENAYNKTEEEKNLFYVETVDRDGFARLYLSLLESYGTKDPQ